MTMIRAKSADPAFNAILAAARADRVEAKWPVDQVRDDVDAARSLGATSAKLLAGMAMKARVLLADLDLDEAGMVWGEPTPELLVSLLRDVINAELVATIISWESINTPMPDGAGAA